MARWSPIERSLREKYGPLLAGVDEVGRGPLAGPVVACAIVMPPNKRAIAGVDDSKQLDRKKRESLVLRIRDNALAISMGAASCREIDKVNIYHATVIAMRRALIGLERKLKDECGELPHHILVDGKPIRTLGYTHTAIVRGDARCYNIACASIIAKVTRDRLMRSLAERYDGYGWQQNSGYGTAAHRKALDELGITPHHRKSFCLDEQTSLLLDEPLA